MKISNHFGVKAIKIHNTTNHTVAETCKWFEIACVVSFCVCLFYLDNKSSTVNTAAAQSSKVQRGKSTSDYVCWSLQRALMARKRAHSIICSYESIQTRSLPPLCIHLQTLAVLNVLATVRYWRDSPPQYVALWRAG